MRQLSKQQAAFLQTDTTHSNANVSLLHIFDQSTAPGGVVRFKSILAQIERRLHRSPVFRQRLQQVPFGLDQPYWIDDADFDLEYHVRHIALPKPGDWRQFCIQASRLHARALDRGRPLWEVYVIEGLDSFLDLPPGSFGLLLKTHQAAIDLDHLGELSALLLDDSATPGPQPPPEPWFARSAPGSLALASRGALQSAHSPLRLAGPLLRLVRRSAPAALSLAGELLLRPQDSPVTRFSSVVSAHRVFDTRRFTEDEFARIAKLVRGATVDDVVLAICGDALRRYLMLQHELPEQHDLIANLREAGEPVGAAWLPVRLGTTLDDPLQRIRAIRAQRIARLKAPAKRSLAARARRSSADRRAPPGNCSVTMLPAPARAQYLCGARMSYFSAILPIRDGLGLAFAVTLYDGRLVISPTSCRELLPDPDVLAQALRDSFQALIALAKPPVKAQVKARARPVRSATAGASAAGKARPRRPAA